MAETLARGPVMPRNSTGVQDSSITSDAQVGVGKLREQVGRDAVLFKLLGKDDITNRGDINSVEFLIKLFNEVDFSINDPNKNFTLSDVEEVLMNGYEEAFQKEIQTDRGKKGVSNILMYEEEWKGYFRENVGEHLDIPELSDDLFLLAWVESNGEFVASSELGAQGVFQVLPSTARKFLITLQRISLHDPDNIISVLLNKFPSLSGQVSSLYLGELVEQEKGLGLSDEEAIYNAVRRYNGAWISKVKDSNESTLSKIKDIVNALMYVKQIKDVGSVKEKLVKIQDKYFSDHTFPPLETPLKQKEYGEKYSETYDNVEDIGAWIDRYIEKIIKQQMMYPYQLMAFKKVYYENTGFIAGNPGNKSIVPASMTTKE